MPELTEPELTEPELTEPELTEPEFTELELKGLRCSCSLLLPAFLILDTKPYIGFSLLGTHIVSYNIVNHCRCFLTM